MQLGLKNSSHPNELKGDAIIKDFYLDMGSLLSPAKKNLECVLQLFFGTLDCFSDNIIVAAASAFTVPFVALKSASRSLLFSHFMGGLAHSGLNNLECQKLISFQNVNSSCTYHFRSFPRYSS